MHIVQYALLLSVLCVEICLNDEFAVVYIENYVVLLLF